MDHPRNININESGRHAHPGARAITALLAWVILLLAGCGSPGLDEGGTGRGGTGGGRPTASTTYGMRDGIPVMTLSDGTQVTLERLDLWAALREQFPAPPETAPDGVESSALSLERFGSKSRPDRVDLRDLQTPIRNQGGRGTCVAHATIAALEAAYARERGMSLDLSEQYANHVQKMTHLADTPVDPAERESQLGAWGGSGVGYQLGWLFRLQFGLPEESAMEGIDVIDPSVTYISSANYQNTDQPGDMPRMNWRDESLTQRSMDAWNLSPAPVTYSIPESRTLVNFPRNAPTNAVYGATRVRAITPSLGAIRDELAAGREVAFGVALTRIRDCRDGDDNPLPESDPCYDEQDADQAAQYQDGIWRPLETDWGGHAMLIVGYDDDLRAFIVKNSWGVDETDRGRPVAAAAGTSGFIYMSYDWISKIHEAYSVLETRSPTGWRNNQPFLGKWHVETDLPIERADLAAYHLPRAFPPSALGGRIDRRIGTLHADRDYRVNGSIGGDRMVASFGSPEIDSSYDSTLGGTKIVALRIDGDTLAGWTHPADNPDAREPFLATIGDYPAMQHARETEHNPAPIDFFGSWRVVGAGLDGVIEFVGDITDGTYTPSDSGSAVPGVELEINPRTFISDPSDPCFVRINVPGPEAVTLDGLLFCETVTSAQRALITGIGDETGVGDARGFYAYRERLDPAVIIQSPSDGSVVPRGRQRVELRARTVGFVGSPAIRWTSDVDGFLGESTGTIALVDLSFGTHVVTASISAPDGELTDTVELTISNDAPVVDIVTPNGIGSSCAGEAIRFLATSRDLNNTPTFDLPESAIEWSVAGSSSFGTGHSVTASFPEGGYTIVVRATDDQGAFAEDSVNLFVETCINEPPTATILQPALDSGTSEAQYAYDGFDDARGQWYTDLTFVGVGEDPEDGTLNGSSLSWTTDRTDLQTGTLGTGGSVTARLYSSSCFGTWHEVKLTVTDSDGTSRSAVRRIFIWTLC